MRTVRIFPALLLLLACTVMTSATDYTTFLTAGRGFTEVTTAAAIRADADYCYLLTPAETLQLIVGVGSYEAKPDWAGDDTKALRYRPADTDPVLDLSNFFTIERSGSYIGLRNMVYDTDLFQTHDNAGYMYVNTYTDKTLDEWSLLKPTYQNGYWLFESGKYPLSSDNWACGYLGPWNRVVADGEPIALNRRNTDGDEAGHYRLWRITRADLFAHILAATTVPASVAGGFAADMTGAITNPSFENGTNGWTLINKADGNSEFTARTYSMTGRAGNRLMNAFQWWAPSLSVTQTVTGLPAGIYELSATMASWEGRTVTLAANACITTATGVNDASGIKMKVPVTIGTDGRLVIAAGSTTDWWTEGRNAQDNDPQCFFKLDDVQLHLVTPFTDDTPAHSLREGTFTAVALNVDGLPNKVATIELNPDGPGAEGTKKISQYLAWKDYDLIGCSEDFNYNGSLMESLSDRYSCGTIRNTLSVGDLNYWQLLQGKLHVDTDGLNLIWKRSKTVASNESWTKWNDTEATDGNQYVNKGYRHYDMTLDGDVDIDVFILHLDAGGTNATWSRESQWRQLADAVNASDHTRPKLIIGDTNSRWTREDISGNFANRLSADFTISDAWVELHRDGIYPTTTMPDLTDQSDPTAFSNYEVVDKIIYINPATPDAVHLTPLDFRIEQDYTYGTVAALNGSPVEDNTPLGDHRPLVVTFKYTAPNDDPAPGDDNPTPGDDDPAQDADPVLTAVQSPATTTAPGLVGGVFAASPSSPAFDLQGRRQPVRQPASGISIVNGRKVTTKQPLH